MAYGAQKLRPKLPSWLPTGKAITARFLRTFFLLGSSGLPTPPFFRSESSLTSIRDIQRNMCAKEANKVENWDSDRKKNIQTCATLSWLYHLNWQGSSDFPNISSWNSAKLFNLCTFLKVRWRSRKNLTDCTDKKYLILKILWAERAMYFFK